MDLVTIFAGFLFLVGSILFLPLFPPFYIMLGASCFLLGSFVVFFMSRSNPNLVAFTSSFAYVLGSLLFFSPSTDWIGSIVFALGCVISILALDSKVSIAFICNFCFIVGCLLFLINGAVFYYLAIGFFIIGSFLLLLTGYQDSKPLVISVSTHLI
ncbi:hypothetical protein P9112_006439 [Eukaryota sp. TZLM1-RC]